jgi:hypothetical protein
MALVVPTVTLCWRRNASHFWIMLLLVRREDRQGVRVKVPNGERVANDIGPESCAAAREGRREALTGARSGWPLSRESTLQSADAVSKAEGHTDGGVNASLRPALRGLRPQHDRTLPAREPGYLACRSGTLAWPAGGRP